MRNTRTVAACVAATTLFGLLSATPALASELDRGDASIVQGQELSGSGLGLLGRSATELPAAPSDRGEAGMATSQQSAGPDAGLPGRPLPTAAAETAPATEPAKPAPEAATPAQSSSVDVTLVSDGAVVSLPEDLYRSAKRIVVIVEGRPVAQIQNQQTRGTIFSATHTDGDPVAFLVPDVKPGDRMVVTEYVGTLDSGFDDSLRRQRLFAGTLGEAVPAPASAAPTTVSAPVPAAPAPSPAPAPAAESSPSPQTSPASPEVTVSFADHRVMISMARELYDSRTRVDIRVNNKWKSQTLAGYIFGGGFERFDGDRVIFSVGNVDSDDQVKIAEVTQHGDPTRVLFDEKV
ncbi:hypothetical protein EDF35_2841 [Rathayibacter sp. PhB151]|uniref:hypothetical protein n=1 Tax=Rathayibacter sp. PhB151 TaxID=2485189 RepID=UPI0010DB5BDC|nr:hypothetical protein [Rathayibacter sp. PhB151]TDX77333.1 hypothetical protein EDF35_2841 [Rathayibacter sp. PhB151]